MKGTSNSILRTLPVQAAGALCAALLVASSAAGQELTANSLNGYFMKPSPGGIAGAGYLEDFESGYFAGPINGQNGWTICLSSAGSSIITFANPIEGNVSARHVSSGTAPANGCMVLNVEFPGGTQFGSVSARVVIGNTASLYQFVTVDLDSANEFYNTRVQFNPATMHIEVAQVNAQKTAFEYIDTGVTWAIGTSMRICIEVVDENGELNVYKDGLLIFTGEDTTHDLAGLSNGIGGYLTYTNGAGTGSPDGSGATYTIDDFSEDCGTVVGPPCPPDTNGDTEVDVGDLVNVIVLWETSGQAPGVDADINDDGEVDVLDLVQVITNWGLCPVLNDQCIDAIVVGNGTTGLNTGDATLDGSAPPFTCAPAVNDVWFKYTSTCDGILTIDTNGSGFDTVLQVYAGSTCPPGAPVACDNDSGTGNASMVVINPVLAGQSFTIRVGGLAADPEDQGLLTINCQAAVPANDACANATLLTFQAGVVTVNGQTNSATPSAEVFPCDSICPVGRDVWFRVQGTGHTMTASLCGVGTNFDTIMMVYCGASCASLGCIGGDDEACGDPGLGVPSEMTWCTAAGQTYWINVQGFRSTDSGLFSLTVTDGATCPVPAACQSGDLGLENDQCVDATEIVGSQDVELNTTGACTDGVAHAACQHDGQTYQDIWYLFEADCNGTLVVSTCNQAMYDSDIAVYDGTNWPAVCPPGNAQLLGCSDDGSDPESGPCADFGGHVEIPDVVVGDRFLIRVGGEGEGSQGVATLTVECALDDNDQCDLAEEIGPPGNPGAFPSVVADNSCGATIEPGTLPNCGNGPPEDHTRWYLTEGDGTSYTVSLCNTKDDGWDTRLTVYCGTCAKPACDLPALFEPIDGCGPTGGNEEITFCTATGTNYLIVVHSGFACGDYTLEITSSGVPCATAACQGCNLNCTGTIEPETCGTTVNNGCNQGGQAFMTPAQDGDEFCGTTWAHNNMRDSDWYLLEVGPSGTVQISLRSFIPLTSFVIRDPAQNCNIGQLVPVGTTAFTENCSLGNANAAGLTPGEMVYVFLAPGNLFLGIFNGYPCGAINEYELTIDSP